MPRSRGIPVFAALLGLFTVFAPLHARPVAEPPQITPAQSELDVVGDPTVAPAAKTLADTIWIADWSFDAPGGGCTDAGWVKYDNRILNDGSNYWSIDNRFSGSGGITGKSAILSEPSLCSPCAYGDNWDYSILLKYRGAGSTLSFAFLSDTEPGYDFVTVEADSAGASEARVNYAVNPEARPADFRVELTSFTGLVLNGAVSGLALPGFGVPSTTHEVYIRFTSSTFRDCSEYPNFWQAGLIVDNIAVTGGLTYTENFEAALNANVTLANSAPATPFGEWARLYAHITDNDKCTENTTCAWLFSDPTRLAFFPNMAFGPGQAVIRNWLDDILVSPWVSLATAPNANGTSLMFRRFGGNPFAVGLIAQGWRVRGKVRTDNIDTPAPGDSIDCVSPWGHATQWNSLSSFVWGDALDLSGKPFDMTANFDPTAREIQVSFRVSDWQLIAGVGPPGTLNPGPGPYLDRVRIGRRFLGGPVIGFNIGRGYRAQDCFPTVRNSIAPGEHFSPDGANRFGSCAFSHGMDTDWHDGRPNVVTGDSIALDNVVDARGAGGVTSVKWYGAIVAGPHAGKAPAPYTVGGNGFFEVTAEQSRSALGVIIAGNWFVDVDDTYFRGGDQLLYFWVATDAAGGFTSEPPGLTGLPASVAAAEAATVGLLEVSYLPTVDWAPAYQARIAADAHGDLDPTAEEVAASTQANCLLYYQHTTEARRSGIRQRTAFMYTLDRLGYGGHYDVYDLQNGYNNELGGRGTVAQASGYALIIQDDGRSNLWPNIPDGNPVDPQYEKINQAQWYRDYLAQGGTGLAGTASLWMIGENTAFEKPTNALFTTDIGLSGIVNDQGLGANPDVEGVASFTWASGNTTGFAGDTFSLNGGCPAIRAYDAANAAGAATRTHSYKSGPVTGGGAIVMNKNAALQWNTIWQGFAWFDMRPAVAVPLGSPDEEEILAAKILAGVLPAGCLRSSDPATGTPDPQAGLPPVTALYANTPNPFNPTTTIRFDLARSGRVELHVFDAAGRRVATLVDAQLQARAGHAVTWNGMDTAGRPVASGVYFYRLRTSDFESTRRLVVLR